MKRRPDLPKLIADLLERRPRPSTLRLVLWVATTAPDGTGKMPIRRIRELLGGSLESVTAAVTEAQSRGWLESAEWVGSREFTLSESWCILLRKPYQSDNYDYDHSVTESVSEPPRDGQPKRVHSVTGKPNHFDANSSHFDTETVTLSVPSDTETVTRSPKSVTETVTKTVFDTETVTPASGTPDATHAGDSPYTLPLGLSSHIERLEESPPVLRTAPLLPKAQRAAAAHLENFERFWRIAPRRVNKSVAREVWVTVIRPAHVDDVIQAAVLWAKRCEGQDAQFIAHPSTWLRKDRWRDEFENAKEAAEAALKPAANGNGNGKPTVSERNRNSRAGFFAAFGASPPTPDSGSGGRSLELRRPDDSARRR